MRYLAILLATILIIGFAGVGYGEKQNKIWAEVYREAIIEVLMGEIDKNKQQIAELKAEIAELRATVAASAKMIEKVKPLTTCARCDNEHGCRLYVICRLPCKCGCLPK